jgi:hypothetical protein
MIRKRSRQLLVTALALLIEIQAGAQESPTRGAVEIVPAKSGVTVATLANGLGSSVEASSLVWSACGAYYQNADDWWALVCSEGCELRPARLQVSEISLQCNGEYAPGQQLSWRVQSTAKPGALIAVMRVVVPGSGLRLQAGPVPTWLHAGAPSYPAGGRLGTLETRLTYASGTELSLVPGYALSASGRHDEFQLELRVGDQHQRLGSFHLDQPETPFPTRAADYLRWAGDLDADGYADFIVRFAGSWQRAVLFLSSHSDDDPYQTDPVFVGESGRFELDTGNDDAW